jgi:NAD(P) transhydrogenase subunit alpha
MKIAVLRETADGERRVAATPETVKKFIALGAELRVEAGAGAGASISDADYEAAGALVGERPRCWPAPMRCLACRGPEAGSLAGTAPGALVVGALDPFRARDRIESYAAAGLQALAMEWMPRITRAQSMDILSSQANLAGYKAVLDAAAEYGRAFPMMMTAAGTVAAAKLFVMGVGVAGCRRSRPGGGSGRRCPRPDVRSATKEQIMSLGAKPIFVENVKGIEGEGAGGYATEMSDEYKAAQAELVSPTSRGRTSSSPPR